MAGNVYRRPSKVVKWMSPVTEHSAEGQRKVADPWELPQEDGLCPAGSEHKEELAPRP